MIEPHPETGAASTAYRRLVDNVRRVIAGNDAAVELAARATFVLTTVQRARFARPSDRPASAEARRALASAIRVRELSRHL